MPQFTYRGRDKQGQLRVGQRAAENIDIVNNDLIKEGIFPIEIELHVVKPSIVERLKDYFQGRQLQLEELSVFSRQMQQLQNAGVPIVSSLRQLARFTRSHRLAQGITGLIEHLEKGQSLATGMRNYPNVFNPLMITLVDIGESTGHLADAFGNLHNYLEFELSTRNQFKTAFRYPMFILITITIAIIVLNVFVIPSFARFYSGTSMQLPWQTRLLIGMSNVTINYGVYIMMGALVVFYFLRRYLRSISGKYKWDKLKLRLPIFRKFLRHIILIRFSQALAIILNSGIAVNTGLKLVKNIIENSFINAQITTMEEAIERGNTFTQAVMKVEVFSPLELQIISVGEKNGQLGPALSYISSFHTQEVGFELKKMNDAIGPILIGVISVFVLIIALGVYLPIWNMINLAQHG